jgi:hypothetical protein
MTAEGYRDMHSRYIRVLCVHQPEPRGGGGMGGSLGSITMEELGQQPKSSLLDHYWRKVRVMIDKEGPLG